MLHQTLSSFESWRLAQSGRIGFVPTMGALHEGHAALLRRAREENDRLVLSIFVNPTQFGPTEDLSRYPRTLDADLEVARACGVDAVLHPSPQEMYPAGFSTSVNVGAVAEPLCGAFRPGHFEGVATVVLKLFNIVRPTAAYFGLKDAQQFLVIEQLVRDLNLGVALNGVPTVRENDGLAMSSRNRYLNTEERERAALIYQTLQDCVAKIKHLAPVQTTLEDARKRLEAAGFQVQYFELRTRLGLKAFSESHYDGTPALLAVAAYLGKTRLIDNLFVN